MSQRFDFIDIVMLFKILNGLISINLPSYLHFFSGKSRLRFCHLDTLSLVSDILPNTTANHTSNAFANSFFYRSHLLWNRLPFDIRNINCIKRFKKRLNLYFLDNLLISGSEQNDSLNEMM